MAQLMLAPPAALVCLITWRSLLALAGIGESAREPWPIVLMSGTLVVAAAAFLVRSVVEQRLRPLVAMIALAAGITAVIQGVPALLETGDIRYRLSWDHFLAGTIVVLIGALPVGSAVSSLSRFIAMRFQRRATHD
jgi:hypothetical protein